MRFRSLGAATTVVVVALAGAACGSGDRTEVLGEVYERPVPSTTVTPMPAGADIEPVATAPSSTSVPAPPASDGEQPAPARTAAAAPSTTVTPMPAPRPVTREYSDNATTAVVLGGKLDAAVSSSRIEEGAANPFAFDISLPAEGEPVTLQVSLTNAGSGVVEFPGGLTVALSITRDGEPWRVDHAGDPAVTSLAPGATWSTTITVPAEGDGVYDISAFVDVVHA